VCLILVAWKAHRDYRLVLAANRDEYFGRRTSPASFWDDHLGVLAGRDLEAGGSWLGVTLQGKFAAVTNYRSPPTERRADAPTRGRLVSDYLTGRQAPETYVGEVAKAASRYNGFSLLAGDLDSLYFLSNRGGKLTRVAPGLHALSNHLLDTPWPKVEKGKAKLAALLQQSFDAQAYLAALDDTETLPDAPPANIGLSPEIEERLSAMRILPTAGYGTRCSTVLCIGQNGRVEFHERNYREDGASGGLVSYRFTLAGVHAKARAPSPGAGSPPRKTPLRAR
jgi:uncharacterized protein with NRDE domain